MSRKHFEAVAAAFKNRLQHLAGHKDYSHEVYDAAVSMVYAFAAVAASDNPKFNTRRFLAACGINS